MFFKNKDNNYNLFGFLFHPEVKNSNNRRGVIFCDSIGNEKYSSHRVLVNFARLLQENGYIAFLFDYYGNGDSDGDFEDTTLDTYLSDIKTAIEFLTEETKAEEICLLGLRVGAIFASLLAREKEIVKNLILWAPIINARKYIYDSLRSNLNMQLTIHGKLKFNRDQLIEQIQNDVTVETDGYTISKGFYQSLLPINLNTIDKPFTTKTLVIELSRNSNTVNTEFNMLFKDNNQCLRMVIAEDIFWTIKGTNQRYITRQKVLFGKTLSWLG